VSPGAERITTSDGWRSVADEVPATLIRELVARAATVDDVAAVSGHVLAALDHGGVSALPRMADRPAPGLVGVAVAHDGDPAEVVVDPVFRGRGIGSALVQAAVDRQGAVWAYGNLPAAAAIATRLGLVSVRELLKLRLDLPADSIDPAPVELPAGVRVRRFIPGRDEEAFLGVNARAFAWHPEQGRLDAAGLHAEMAQDWFDPAGFFLAVTDDEDERVLGFHWTKVHPSDPPVGEVYVLGVDPAAGVRGLGGPLTTIGLDHLRRQGLGAVILYVESDNERAVRLYERHGFRTSVRNVVYARVGTSAG
jgi:mycothiol synthase